MNEKIIFESEKNLLKINFLYSVEKYFTFSVEVKSGYFSGKSNFCFSDLKIKEMLNVLKEMNVRLCGECEIKDNDTDSFFKIEMGKRGHAFASGQIGGSHEDNYMKFMYDIDQTVLMRLIKLFQKVLVY